jgi:uncharacterized protein
MEENRVLSESEKNWAMLCHLAGFGSYVFPLGGSIIGPLILWQVKKSESAWIDENGKAALNFNLSIALYCLLIIPLCFILIGFVFIGFLQLLRIICVIIASINAGRGEKFKYPLAIPFIQ